MRPNQLLCLIWRFIMNFDIYCDSDSIKEIIEKYEPLYGLYIHEIALITYADFCGLSYPNPVFPPVFSYTLYIKYPAFFLHSVLEKGYLTVKPASEWLDHLCLKTLNSLLENYKLKKSNSCDNAMKRIFESLSPQQIDEYLGSFYVPSKLGEELLKKTKPLHLDFYNIEKNECLILRKSKPAIDISKFEVTECRLYIDYFEHKTSVYILYSGCDVKQEVKVSHFCNYMGKMSIYVNNEFVGVVQNISEINVLNAINRVLLISGKNVINYQSWSKQNYSYYCVNAEESRIEISETLDNSIYIYDRKEISNLCSNSFCNDDFVFFFSYGRETAKFILNYLLKKHDIYLIEKIGDITDNDEDENYVARIRVNNKYAIQLIAYLSYESYLLPPRIKGVDVSNYVNYLRIIDRSEISKTHSMWYRYETTDYLQRHNMVEQANNVLSYFDNDKERMLKEICGKFTQTVLDTITGTIAGNHIDIFSQFKQYVKQNPASFREEVTKILVQLYDSKELPNRWISELSLYLLVRESFLDTIYQYRAEWLGQQSLDMFIPSHNIAIEYQGKQHYEPVAVFGGDEHFTRQKERDAKKRKLCKEKGIILIEWRYTTPITYHELKVSLERVGITLQKQ